MKSAINLKTALIAAVIIVLGYLVYSNFLRGGQVAVRYQTALVERGDIRSFVTATGTVNPERMVEITSPVSGTVKEVFVDFNSRVKQGEPLLQIEREPFLREVERAEADLKKAKAELLSISGLYKTNKELYEKNLISKQEFSDSKSKYSSALAQVEQAEASLSIAKTNLEATTLRSPLEGVVISRKVEAGQRASPTTPNPLFLLGDTSEMIVEANVSEADIGRVQTGKSARFTVDAYRGKTFQGEVSQIRNEPIITNNVVTYEVVVKVDNPEGLLKPGMTADVRVLVAEKKDVLRVPRAALRFVPPPGSKIARDSGDISGDTEGATVVWSLKDSDVLKPIAVKPGISDENFTEILNGSTLSENQEIVVGAIQRGTAPNEPLGPIRLPQPKRF